VFQAVDGVVQVGALAEGLVAAGAEAKLLGEGVQIPSIGPLSSGRR
jgi:hypothetical protein